MRVVGRYRDGQSWVEIRGVEPGQKGPLKTVRARHVITCAGLQSDLVAKLADGQSEPRVIPFRGT
jgi:L-2-hydroxyglutarate oxidase LhgO